MSDTVQMAMCAVSLPAHKSAPGLPLQSVGKARVVACLRSTQKRSNGSRQRSMPVPARRPSAVPSRFPILPSSVPWNALDGPNPGRPEPMSRERDNELARGLFQQPRTFVGQGEAGPAGAIKCPSNNGPGRPQPGGWLWCYPHSWRGALVPGPAGARHQGRTGQRHRAACQRPQPGNRGHKPMVVILWARLAASRGSCGLKATAGGRHRGRAGDLHA